MIPRVDRRMQVNLCSSSWAYYLLQRTPTGRWTSECSWI